jgi:hypothetical protein
MFFCFWSATNFAARAISPGFVKGDLTGKAEIPLPNPPRRRKKFWVLPFSVPDHHKSAGISHASS